MKLLKMRKAAVLTLALAALAIVQPVRAQQGSAEGIKVHGRWTIDVRNPDGTLASHNEFDNALTLDGRQVLAGLLSRFWQAGEWRITLFNGLAQPNPCGGVCVLNEHVGPGAPGLGELGINLALDTSGRPTGTFNLSGATQATTGGLIDWVATIQVPAGFGFKIFTEHQLAAPITVTPNQIIQVTVVFSFS